MSNAWFSLTTDGSNTWTLLSQESSGSIDGGGEIASAVESDLVLFWDIRGYVTSDLTLFWSVEPPFVSVVSDLTLNWNIITEPTTEASVTSDLVLFWQRASSVTSDLTLTWKRYGVVGQVRVLSSANRISVDPPTLPTLRAVGRHNRIKVQRAA